MTTSIEPRYADWRKICACCGYRSIPDKGERYTYGLSDINVCRICGWGDDDQGLDDDDVPSNTDGINGGVSLRQARTNFLQFGRAHPLSGRQLRKPLPHERPPDWTEPDLTPKFTESERLAKLVPTKWIKDV